MAHRGKFYPLALRRDWQIQSQGNSFGVAEQYLFKFEHWVGSVGSVLDSTTRLLSNPTDAAGPTLEWKSAPITIGARTVTVVLISNVSGSPQVNNFWFELRQLGGPLLAKSGFFQKFAHPCQIGGRQHNVSPMVLETPGVITQVNDASSDTYTAKGYP